MAERTDKVRIELQKCRHQAKTDPISGNVRYIIRFIMTGIHMKGSKEFMNLLFRHTKERADNPSPLWLNAGETFEPAAPEEVKKNRFCLVILMMGSGQLRKVPFFHNLIKGILPKTSSYGLYRTLLFFSRFIDIHIPTIKRYPPLTAQGCHIDRFLFCRLPQMVIYTAAADVDGLSFFYFLQKIEEAQ